MTFSPPKGRGDVKKGRSDRRDKGSKRLPARWEKNSHWKGGVKKGEKTQSVKKWQTQKKDRTVSIQGK